MTLVRNEKNLGLLVRNEKCNVFQCNVPEDCTDACAIIDAGLGWFLKKFIAAKYREDYESSPERTDDWTDGNVPLWEVRILLSIWAGEAWSALQNRPSLITKTFKACGFYNDINGRENYLIKCRKVNDYQSFLREKGDDPIVALSNEDAIALAVEHREKRQAERERKRKEKRKKALLKRKKLKNN